MSTWQPKIGRHINYRDATGRWRTGTITAVVDPTHVTFRMGHYGVTKTNIAKLVAHSDTNVWKSF